MRGEAEDSRTEAGAGAEAEALGRKALAICTVSDHIVTGEETTAAEREQTFGQMVEIALATIIK